MLPFFAFPLVVPPITVFLLLSSFSFPLVSRPAISLQQISSLSRVISGVLAFFPFPLVALPMTALPSTSAKRLRPAMDGLLAETLPNWFGEVWDGFVASSDSIPGVTTVLSVGGGRSGKSLDDGNVVGAMVADRAPRLILKNVLRRRVAVLGRTFALKYCNSSTRFCVKKVIITMHRGEWLE